MKRIVLATFNKGKVREVASILSGLRLEVVSPPEVGVNSLPEETGDTFLDNAILKASHVLVRTGLPAMADDSGLEVRALSGAPGVHSARYGGVEHDDEANIRKLLAALRNEEDRAARFVCTVVFLVPGKESRLMDSLNPHEGVTRLDGHPMVPDGTGILVAYGEVHGRIIDTPSGSNGFGYDPVFFRDDLGLTFAQLTGDEKNALSHRGQAFRSLRLAFDDIMDRQAFD